MGKAKQIQDNRLRLWRIEMQKCCLDIEAHELRESAPTLPEPLVLKIKNLVRDLENMQL